MTYWVMEFVSMDVALTLKFDMCLSSSAAETLAKFQTDIDTQILNV